MDDKKLPYIGKNTAIELCKILDLDPEMVRRVVIDVNSEDVLMAKVDIYIPEYQENKIIKTIGNACEPEKDHK